MKKVFYIFLLISASLHAQQVGMYSHTFFKPMLFNPAFTGKDDATNAMVISRAQWTDINGAPQLNLASLDGNIVDKKVGLGIMLVSDKKGITNRTGGEVYYSYRVNINDDMHLRFGVSLGVVEHTVDFSKAITETSNDPTLFTDKQSKVIFNGNAGLGLVWKELEFGFAVPQLIGNKVNYADTSNVRSTYSQVRHYMGSLKYSLPLSKEKGMYITPCAIIRFIPNTPFQYDAGINFEWRNKFWIGAAYKSAYAVSANVGFAVHKQLSVGYSYDIITGSIGKYSGMAHELMINFRFGRKKAEEERKDDKQLKNAMYESKLDSLQDELEISRTKERQLGDKVDQLSRQMEQMKTQQQTPVQYQNQNQPPVNNNQQVVPQNNNQQGQNQNQSQPQNNSGAPTGNQNAAVADESPNKRFENGALIVSGKTSEFKDDGGIHPPKGYYVVIGTYFYRDLAVAEAQRFVARGYKTTDWVYSGPKNYNYIFMFKLKTKEEAMEKLKVARDAGVKDAWIQEITD
ncbi:MAG: type IX secretion system membrane protein PorP/SprF [Bacteroidia bacterium]